jgi:pimeloyl-[acyl-carrier protein] methyl ester esterase
MPDKWIVFGGWALRPDLLRPLFGDNSIYVDTNDIMPALVKDGKLLPDWVDIARTKTVLADRQADYDLAGWSTGAIVACALSATVPVKKLVLLSSTPSFCMREGFSFGQRPKVLDVMRRGLLKPGNNVVGDFGIKSGISGAALIKVVHEPQNLVDGLHFLEQVDLLPHLRKIAAHARVFHGAQDPIVSPEAGKMLSDLIGAEFSLLPGGHAFFLGRPEMKFVIP